MPRLRATSRPRACGLLLMTAAIRAGNRASSTASMLLPRPEIRITRVLSANDDLRAVLPAPLDAADAPGGFACGLERFHRCRSVRGSDDRHHADAAVEHTIEFRIGDAAFLLQPLTQVRQVPALP